MALRRSTGAVAALLALALAGCALGPDPQPAGSSTPSRTHPAPGAGGEPNGPGESGPAPTGPAPGTEPATGTGPAAGEEPSSPVTTPAPDPGPAQVRAPGLEVALVPGDDAVGLALSATRTFWVAAPLVVVARAGDKDALAHAEQAGVPVLLTEQPAEDEPEPPALPEETVSTLHAELARLGTRTVVSFDPRLPLPEGVGTQSPEDEVPAEARPTQALDGVGVLVDGKARSRAAAVTAAAAGAHVYPARGGDPRASRELLAAYADGAGPSTVVALGSAFDATLLRTAMRSVRTGVTLPHGSQLVFDDTRYVALYGSPLTPALGVLGEQSPARSVARARKVAEPYRKLVEEQVVPMFEVIVTVASAGAGEDGNYSNELDVEQVRPYVEVAREQGVYVLLDLQPGRTDFLTQAKQYEELLREPHVGLALDPEWRLKKNQRHLRQIGSVKASEVNTVADWLATLVREAALPQKMFVVHQFTSSMVRKREQLDTSHPELAHVIHVDGQGTQAAKHGTWRTIRKNAPEGLHWGWKNFYDEDRPMATPKQTVRVEPTPDLITYQ